MTTSPIVIERTYNVSIAKVWKAITDKDEMKHWYFDVKEFKAEVGFEFRFLGGETESKQYLHICKITEVIQGKKIAYSWRYDKIEGNSIVTFELTEEGSNRTKLKLTHEGIETFKTSNPDFAKESFTAGWNHIIGTGLKEYVEK